jgi:pyridoxine 5-phosphate synthase
MNPLIHAPGDALGPPTALSVNVNKVALLRNTRSLGIPSVVLAAQWALEAGAQGITVHPRPDERHIRRQDVQELAALMQQWPQAEFNIEGNPTQNLMGLLEEVLSQGLTVHQCTFVPDSESQATSDHGWNLAQDAAVLEPLVCQARSWGLRVSLFMDADAQAMVHAAEVGTHRVELYTEPYAAAFGQSAQLEVLARFAEAAQAAKAAGLGVNAGHDLNRANLTPFLSAVSGVSEVSIGHALVADALELGMKPAVAAYLNCIRQAFMPKESGAQA